MRAWLGQLLPYQFWRLFHDWLAKDIPYLEWLLRPLSQEPGAQDEDLRRRAQTHARLCVPDPIGACGRAGGVCRGLYDRGPVGFGRTLNHPSKGGSAMVVQTWERGSLVRKQVERFSDEFRGTFGVQTIARYVHESLADLEGARVKEYVPIFVERSARERLRALAHSQGAIMKDRPEVLFVCVHNAGRSQMAAALTQQLSGGRVHVRSAGSEPAGRINLAVIEVMDELGLDLLQEFPEPLTDEVVKAADVVITMGCGDACPLYPGKRYEDWELDDPAGQPVEKVRQIREAIRGHVEQLLDELGVPIQR